MVKIRNIYGDEYRGKQRNAVYQRKYGRQIRRIKEDKKANRAPAQLEQQRRFKIGISWYKSLSYFEKEGLKLFLNERGITLTPQQYAIKTALDRGKVTKIVLGEQVIGEGAVEGWDAEGWNYRQEITLTNNTASNLTNYQVKLELDASKVGAHFDWARMGADLRFYDESGNKLAYWVGSWDEASKQATIWVKVGLIPGSGSTTIKMYYGNSEAVSESNGNAVFEMFVNSADEWVEGSNDVTITDDTVEGAVKFAYTSTSTRPESYVRNVPQLPSKIILEFSYKFDRANADWAFVVRDGVGGTQILNMYVPIASEYDTNNGLWFYTNQRVDTGHDMQLNTWEKFSLIIDIDNDVVYIREPVNGGTTNYAYKDIGSASKIGYFALYQRFNTGNAWIRNLRVRKYAEQEPTAEFGAEEEAGPGEPVTVTVEHIIVEHSGIMNVYYYDENNELIEEKTDLSDIASGDIATRLDFINRTEKTVRTVIIESISGVLNKVVL